MSKTILSGLLIFGSALFPVADGFAQLHCSDNWTPEYKCLEHCGPCPTTVDSPSQQDSSDRKRMADEADRQGMEAAKNGDWQEAANRYMEALRLAPNSPESLKHLEQANAELRDIRSAADISALRQRIQDAISAARIEGMRLMLEDEIGAQRLNAMSENFRAGTQDPSKLRMSRVDGRAQALYPALNQSVSPSSPPARVLSQYQPKIKEIDQEIHRAQDALRRLIRSNAQSEEERLEWTMASERATVDAMDLSVSLVIDLFVAHVDDLAKTSGEERADVLDHLLNRAEGDGQRNSIHSAYGMLVNRKIELERIRDELRLAGKENDLRIKIRDFSVDRDTEFTRENFWDVISQFKKVEDLTGPGKHLLDAAYTIYRQAASLENLAVIQSNQEKTLKAAEALRGYILRLQAKKAIAQ